MVTRARRSGPKDAGPAGLVGILADVPQTRSHLTGARTAAFVLSNLREQKGGLTRAWLRRLAVFDEAGWDTHVATVHPQPAIADSPVTYAPVAMMTNSYVGSSMSVHLPHRQSARTILSQSSPGVTERAATWGLLSAGS